MAWIFACWLVAAYSVTARAESAATLDIDLDDPIAVIPNRFYGLMTEEINHSYDGGLFAELIQNRTFQDPPPISPGQNSPPLTPADPPIHWSLVPDKSGKGAMHADRTDPVNAALPISLRLDLAGARAGVANDGYWGIPVRPDTTYAVSFYAKAGGDFSAPVTAAIVTDDANSTVAQADTQPISTRWQKYALTLHTAHDVTTTAKAKFVLSAQGNGSVSFSLVSLFPPTFMDTPGGLRPDLMKLMTDMHPSFIRLPGGNYLEGADFPNRFNWKQMIGPAGQRPGHMGCWSYRSSDGFGLPQYLLWCKQLNAEPVLALFAGFTLNGDHVDAGPKLQPYVDEALEEIEYVSGPADSTWGKQRAADGFPEPFALHYVEVGNEDFFDKSGSYEGRFAQFFDAIHTKYPKLKIIATTPVRTRRADLIDDHFYRSPQHMASDWGHYDNSNRLGPQIFVGEWASQEGQPTPDLNAALGDAAWLMGLERNADLVRIESYAPLLVNVNPADPEKGYPKGWQWGTNLIGYDALSAFGSPSYYVQAMFGQNKGDVALPVTLAVSPTAPVAAAAAHGAIGVGSWRTQNEFKDISVTTPDGKTLWTADLSKDAGGWRFTGNKWIVDQNAIKPSDPIGPNWAIAGDPDWTDYTLRLKARKTGGDEGFLVLFHVIDAQNYNWWNLGGWRNTHTQLEIGVNDDRSAYGSNSSFTVETGRWYNLRVEVRGNHAQCFLDDKLINEGNAPPDPNGTPLFASASYAKATHDVIVKVVNFGKVDAQVTVNLHGVGEVAPTGRASVLTGDPKGVNSIDRPTNIAPKEETITDAAASFQRTFPAHSLTLLRLNVTK
jgi:alpha-N-arabinofuranosidase